ncbi:MAG: acyl-CoA dehydrogenase, partial [Deltaproteobacteria bacterium CG23_combo_of_CG06-09_8_20_14_all_51_20]
MEHEIPESLALMLETVRRFVKQDLEPISKQVEDEDRIPDNIVQTMRDLGLFGLSI